MAQACALLVAFSRTVALAGSALSDTIMVISARAIETRGTATCTHLKHIRLLGGTSACLLYALVTSGLLLVQE